MALGQANCMHLALIWMKGDKHKHFIVDLFASNMNSFNYICIIVLHSADLHLDSLSLPIVRKEQHQG